MADRTVDVHLIVSYSPVSRRFTFEQALGPIAFNGGQVYDWHERRYENNNEGDNIALIIEAGDQLESALRVINTFADAA